MFLDETPTTLTQCTLTVQDHALLVAAQVVGGEARVSAEILVLQQLDLQAERDGVVALVVRLQPVLVAVGYLHPIPQPHALVDRVRRLSRTPEWFPCPCPGRCVCSGVGPRGRL